MSPPALRIPKWCWWERGAPRPVQAFPRSLASAWAWVAQGQKWGDVTPLERFCGHLASLVWERDGSERAVDGV